MTTKKLRLLPLAALLCVAGAQAADMNAANVSRDYTDSVAPAQQQAYEAGVKAYNQCLAQHGFKYAWTAWMHVTGDVYTYSYDSDPLTWSDFDAMHTAGMPCDPVWQSEVNPHLQGETSAFMVGMPEMSHLPGGANLGKGLLEVTYFTLKAGHAAHDAFVDAAKRVARAADKSNWPGDYLFAAVQDGGPGAPDFILVWSGTGWADLNQEVDPPLWKMVANVYGKKKAEEIRKSLNDAIKHTSSHVDAYSADLTYTPAGG